MKTFLLLVLLLCLPHLVEAQVDFTMLEQEYPGPDQGWLPTLIVPYSSETVTWEFPLYSKDAGMTGPRVFIQSGPLILILDPDDRRGADNASLGEGEYPFMQRFKEDYMQILSEIKMDTKQQESGRLP